ncbi:MAG: tetratricopeptide repeat protein, partial [Lachnospiraceae bacterium]
AEVKMKKIMLVIAVMIACLLTGCGHSAKDGVKLLEQGEYKEAIKIFEKSIEKDKNLGESYRGQGIAYWELENYEKAESCFTKAIDNGAKKTGTIFNFIAICNMKQGKMKEALNYFNLGLSMKGNSKKLTQEMEYNEVVVCENLKDWESAKTKMAAYAAKYPEDTKVLKEAEFLETR